MLEPTRRGVCLNRALTQGKHLPTLQNKVIELNGVENMNEEKLTRCTDFRVRFSVCAALKKSVHRVVASMMPRSRQGFANEVLVRIVSVSERTGRDEGEEEEGGEHYWGRKIWEEKRTRAAYNPTVDAPIPRLNAPTLPLSRF